MVDFEKRLEIEEKEKWKEWNRRMPILHFEKEWDVKIIAPFCGALARFTVDYNGKHISAYFDAFLIMAWMYNENDEPIPYWEIYDGEEDIERFDFTQDGADEMMKRIKEILKGDDCE